MVREKNHVEGREKGRSEKILLVRIQTFVLLPAEADAEIEGVTTSVLVGVSGRFEFEMPSRPRSS